MKPGLGSNLTCLTANRASRVDDRRVISGIPHVLKTGCRWRDVPPEYGPPSTIYNRFNRWSLRGLWQRLFEKVAATGEVPEDLSLDSSHVKAHRSAAGGKGGVGAGGRALVRRPHLQDPLPGQ